MSTRTNGTFSKAATKWWGLHIVLARQVWYVVSSGTCDWTMCNVSLTFWCIVRTRTQCVPPVPRNTHCFGRSAANLENPIFHLGTSLWNYSIPPLDYLAPIATEHVHSFLALLPTQNPSYQAWLDWLRRTNKTHELLEQFEEVVTGHV